jgi:hypothetical protein
VMAGLARLSGGKDLTAEPDEAAAVAAIFENQPPALANYRRTPWWNKPGWLAALLGLLTIEWALRRLKGLA